MMLENTELVGATMQRLEYLEKRPLRVYDDTFGEFFLFGNEFGPTWVIRSASFWSAYEIWLDEQKTVPQSELWMAYGFDSEEAYNLAVKETCHGEGFPELVDGYEYQANQSGTGIVDVGPYEWQEELTHPLMDRFGIKLQITQE